MSGGIAYIYDVNARFSANCNREMVDLDPLDEEDAVWLQDMIARHYACTGSTVAKFVLDDFENQQRNFVKVFPRDYKKVLSEKKKQKVEAGK
jgi:glutamate synthase (NADPH/NADH) large chain